MNNKLKVGQSFEVRVWQEAPYYGSNNYYIGKQGFVFNGNLMTPSVRHKGLSEFSYDCFRTKPIGKLTITKLK